ncbi:MAG: hypothetical protein EXS16_14235 [Gemmataceae bacterium]|nr:hypothetical protein [Gemmataceae bacterium]
METEKTYDLELAQRLYLEYYAMCFWHMKPDLVVNQDAIPAVLKGFTNFWPTPRVVRCGRTCGDGEE